MAGVDTWKRIDGYEHHYEVSYKGQVRRLLKNGKYRVLTCYHKKMTGSQRLVVKLTKDGKGREVCVHQLVAKAFLPPCPPGWVPYHINSIITDNWASNIAYISRRELGLKTGSWSNKKAVAKIDSTGEVVDVYSSARVAGKKNFMSYQTILDRCAGKVKGAFAPDGYAYAWEDSEVSMRNAIAKIEKEVGYLPKAKVTEFDW